MLCAEKMLQLQVSNDCWRPGGRKFRRPQTNEAACPCRLLCARRTEAGFRDLVGLPCAENRTEFRASREERKETYTCAHTHTHTDALTHLPIFCIAVSHSSENFGHAHEAVRSSFWATGVQHSYTLRRSSGSMLMTCEQGSGRRESGSTIITATADIRFLLSCGCCTCSPSMSQTQEQTGAASEGSRLELQE